MIADLWQDLRYGARMLLKRPGFTLIIVVTLLLTFVALLACWIPAMQTAIGYNHGHPEKGT